MKHFTRFTKYTYHFFSQYSPNNHNSLQDDKLWPTVKISLLMPSYYLELELCAKNKFKNLDAHLLVTAAVFIWSFHLIWNLGCEAADWKLLITLNAGSVFFLMEGHQQMSWLLYCGTRRLCVGLREQAVVTSFCWLHPLLPLAPTDVTDCHRLCMPSCSLVVH